MKITQSNGGGVVSKILDNLKGYEVSTKALNGTHFYLYNNENFRGFIAEVRYKNERYSVRTDSDDEEEFVDLCELLAVWLKLMG